MKKICLIGNGGFAYEIRDILDMMGREVRGFFDVRDWEQKPQDFLGKATEIESSISPDDNELFIAIGAVDRKSLDLRSKLAETVNKLGFDFASAISPLAHIASNVEIESGAFVAHGATLSTKCKIKQHVIINSNSIIGHDAEIHENTIVAPGAFIGGNTKIGANSIIGPNANILQGLTVGKNVVVSLQANVVRNVKDSTTIRPSFSKKIIK